MSMTDQQATPAEQDIGPISVMAPVGLPRPPRAPRPHDTWDLPGGTAWVYLGDNNTHLTRPVVLADDFDIGRSELDRLYDRWERKDFPFISELSRRDRDLVILGFRDRTRSVVDNAEAAIAAIVEAVQRRRGNHPLVAGGFGMGGLVMRYALAAMEHDRRDHQTATYLSYDTPHRGAWVPICLQAFAHYVSPTDATFSRQINSPACRELLRWHLESVDGTPRQDPRRVALLAALEQVGQWPRRPHKIGVTGGTDDGVGTRVPPGVPALQITGPVLRGTTLLTQAPGDGQQVARLSGGSSGEVRTVTTTGVPPCDGAPGSILDMFGLVGDRVVARRSHAAINQRTCCFVPSVSAVAVRDMGTEEDLYTAIADLSADDSDLDEFRCASRTQPHAQVTPELCEWIIDRLP